MTRCSRDQILHDLHNYCVNLNTREIYLHSYYAKDGDEEPGVDYRQATTFIKNLHLLEISPYKPILVHLHSVGGCWDNGMAIFNAIQHSRCYIKILAYSQASSMSGVIFQAGDLRVMMPDCHFLMHYGWLSLDTTHPFAAANFTEFQKRACKRMIEIFASRAIQSNSPFFKSKKNADLDYAKKFFENKLKNNVDWILTAEEAVYYGLADAIFGEDGYNDLDSLRKFD